MTNVLHITGEWRVGLMCVPKVELGRYCTLMYFQKNDSKVLAI